MKKEARTPEALPLAPVLFSLGNIRYVHVSKLHPQVIIFIQEHRLLPGLTQSCGLIPGGTGHAGGRKGLS